jgi:hypothetical protein
MNCDDGDGDDDKSDHHNKNDIHDTYTLDMLEAYLPVY